MDSPAGLPRQRLHSRTQRRNCFHLSDPPYGPRTTLGVKLRFTRQRRVLAVESIDSRSNHTHPRSKGKLYFRVVFANSIQVRNRYCGELEARMANLAEFCVPLNGVAPCRHRCVYSSASKKQPSGVAP